jgi:broad specificity phosphatase PhoE
MRALRILLCLASLLPLSLRGQTTVILVRHAEKAAAPATDPPLTADGEARARALSETLRDAHVDAIITTNLTRTRATAAPTAKALGITPEVVQAGSATHVQNVVSAIKRHTGRTVLVVGHANTVPEIIAALGGPKLADICDATYDELFVLTPREGAKPSLVQARYGASSAERGCETMKK